MSTATVTSLPQPVVSQLDRRVAVRLMAAEYDRLCDVFDSLTDEQWQAPTDCTLWNVRQLAGHVLGSMQMVSSPLEQQRQVRAAGKRGGVFIDALTSLQVEKNAHLSVPELKTQLRTYARKAAAGRRRTPSLIRRRVMPVPQRFNGVDEQWTIGYLLDVILTRDTWMHRIDVCRAVGRPPLLTRDADAVLVDDVVREWAQRHGQPCQLTLHGEAGGSWRFGDGGDELALDAVEFCRILSGRGRGEGLLSVEVPF